MSHYKIDPVVLIGIPTLMDRPLSWRWTEAYMGLQFPLGCSVARRHLRGQEIGLARNQIVEEALRINANYVLFISDDVLIPPRGFEFLARHKKDVVTGMYWSKTHPTKPYIWKDMMKGPYEDWTYGEFFKVDWAGCDCLLVHTDVFRKMEPPWFSTNWSYSEGDPKLPLATEDLYFYTKLKQMGIDLWCDSEVQCGHEDRTTGYIFGLTDDMPHVKKRDDWKLYGKGKKVADIGCGADTPYFGKETIVTRIDGDPGCNPDILCDIRAIPVPKETFDVVHARHVLEHFFAEDIPKALAEWSRLLKVGGELIVNVPDLAHAAKEILKADENPNYDASYAFWQVYGLKKQFNIEELHKCGFTKNGLLRMVGSLDYLKDVTVESTEGGQNLTLRAIKKKSSDPFAILPNWYGADDEKPKAKETASVAENGKILKPKTTKKVKV